MVLRIQKICSFLGFIIFGHYFQHFICRLSLCAASIQRKTLHFPWILTSLTETNMYYQLSHISSHRTAKIYINGFFYNGWVFQIRQNFKNV